MADRELIAKLVAALEVTSGALAVSTRGGDTILFTGQWSHFGALKVSQILDQADAALTSADLASHPAPSEIEGGRS